MSNIPPDLKYTATHEWVRIEGDIATIGITDHAQDELGDITFVDLPEPGRILQAGAQFGEVESVKAVSEIYSPVSGEVVESNSAAQDRTELLNEDPYGNGWLIRVHLSSTEELAGLLSSDDYARQAEAGGH